MASIVESLIGACYLRARARAHRGGGARRVRARRSSSPSGTLLDFKSALQERLARRGRARRLRGRRGVRARRTTGSSGSRRGSAARSLGAGTGSSKKAAEQAAAAEALEESSRLSAAAAVGRDPVRVDSSRLPATGPESETDASEVDHPEGLQVLPRAHPAGVLSGRQRDRRARTAAASRTSPTPSSGRSASRARWRSAASRCRT